jgi:outer membrane lipoprotein SlyB
METELHYVIRKDDGTVINLNQVPEDGDAIIYPGQRVMLQRNGEFTRIYPADVEHLRNRDSN